MSENKPKRYTVTAALPYANGPLHIGHIAGAYLPADIFVRYKKLTGHDVAFICGSDEHGAAITIRAKKEGISPQEIVDKYHFLNKKAFEDFGIQFDIFHRTSSEIHHQTAQEFFKDIYAKGEFTEETTNQFYDEEHKQFLADRYVTGECPKCNYSMAYGDQCEKCGSSLNPNELINPKSILSGKTPILKETTHFFLPMNKHEQWLKNWIENGELNNTFHHHPKEWRNHVIGQCKSWIDGGLQPRAITRDLDWGIKVPLPNAQGKVLYVWFDAPIGYVSATKQWAKDNHKNWEDYWKSPDTELIHFIGKDNIVFHCIIFPIILKLKGDYVLPTNVPANEFLNLEGNKLSTSRNWAVWLHEYLNEFPNKQDELRYVLTSIAPETKDSEFTWKDFQARINNELVAILGNFINRVAVLTHKFYYGKTPTKHSLFDIDLETINLLKKYEIELNSHLNAYKFRDAQSVMMQIARLGNKYLADTEPWKLVKENPERVETIMNIAIQLSANLSVATKPFLPKTATKIQTIFNLENIQWSQLGNIEIIENGHEINKSELIFSKIEDAEIDFQIQKLEQTNKHSMDLKVDLKPQKEICTFDDFMKLDIRVGKIIDAVKVPKADKLLQLTVDTGIDKRIILSGIAEHYTPEEVIGKQVSVLINLAPRKIRGIESNGMILMAENNVGKLTFVQPETEIEAGSEIR